MTDLKDNQLLEAYAAERSERAFAALVSRHAGLVYSTALRQLGDRMLAEEVAQNVFVVLARKPWSFRHESTLAGWLYKMTLLQSRQCIRSELRRRHREEIAVELGVAGTTDATSESLAPLLDEAMLSLREKDRLAVVLRFFEDKPLRDVGETLGISEDAAQKRVSKALEALTHFFRRRGFTVAALTAGAPLLTEAAQAAPAGLPALLTQTALTQASFAPSSGIGLFLVKLMTLTKTQTAAVCVLIGAIPLVIEWQALDAAHANKNKANAALQSARVELSDAKSELANLGAQKTSTESALAMLRQLAAKRAAAVVRPAAADPDMYPWSDSSDYVRVPKTLLTNIALRPIFDQPVKAYFAVSDEFTALLGITSEQKEKLNADLATIERRYIRLRAEHLQPTDDYVLLSRDSVEGAERVSFQAQPFPEQGAELRASIDKLVLSVADEERLKLFWQQAQSILDSRFGRFGRDDRHYTFTFRRTPNPRVFVAVGTPVGSTSASRGYGNDGFFDLQGDDYAPDTMRPILAGWRAELEKLKAQPIEGSKP